MNPWRAALVVGILLSGPGTSWATEPDEEDEEPSWDVSQPPGTWQSVTIDTEEITWSSVDVSPDGNTLVFDMLGDLYTVPIGGGDAHALTEGIEWNVEPRFSPDGRTIAFISDRGGGDNLWLMNADGSNLRAVTKEDEHLVHNPSWSPDGQYLVAKKGIVSTRSIPAGEIWLFHRGGGEGVQLIEHPDGERAQKNIAEPAFSPDGRHLYFSQDTTAGRVWQYDKDSTGQIFTIERLDRETGERETFIAGAGGAIRPTPSPDGRYLAFVKRTPAMTSALYLMDLKDGRQWAIFDSLERDLQETNGSQGNTPAFAWTPDSASLVSWAGGKIHRIDIENRQTRIIPVRVRAEKKIHPALRFPVAVSPDEVEVKMVRWAQRSPSGPSTIFQALGRLWSHTGEGPPQRLTEQEDHFEHYPAFSRDGHSLAYTTWDDQDLGTIRVIPTAGGPSRTLVSAPGIYLEPAFSPDGQQMVYRKSTGGYLLSAVGSIDPGIYLVATAGGKPKRLLDAGFQPHFGARDDRVYFLDNVEETQLALKSVDLEGRDERTHLQGTTLTEMRVSPDGQWVAFTEQFNAYVTPFARSSGKTVNIGPDMGSMPVRQVAQRSGEFLHWSADSSTLFWALGATLYQRQLKDAFAFLEGAPDELPEPVTQGLDLTFHVAADKPTGRHLALRGARIVTMRDAENIREVIENGVVVVKGDRIVAVGTVEDVDIPDNAEVIDVTGKTILPGLVDVHAHGSMASNEIVPQQNREQLANLAFGVTTVHDPSNDTSSIFAAAEMQRAGLIVAPRIFSTGTIIYGAHVPGVTAKIESYEDALFHVRRLKAVGAISVKSYNQPRRDQRQQVIAAGLKLGIMVVPEGGAKFQHNMGMVVDGHTGIEHCLPIATGYDDVKQLWSQTSVGYTPTLGVAYGGLAGENYWYEHTEVWKNERLLHFTPRFLVEPRAMRRSKAPDLHYNHIEVARFAKDLRDHGVSVQLGAHGQREGLAAHWELWMLEQGGFSPWEAWRAGTIDGARYVGLDGDIGSLEVDKLADLVVIEGDPLSDLRSSENVLYTLLGGRLYDAATMNQVFPERVEREPLFFEKEGGDTIHPQTVERVEEMKRHLGWVH
jgi:imidazolonepropionase-like amidohydrolase/Tol biopolymer transport system component